MRQFQSFLFFCLFVLLCGTTLGQAYPTRPIKLVYPFPPGTNTEVLLRTLAQRLSDSLKQPVVIENRPGAGSMLGTDAVAKAAPDGYTLLTSFNSAIAPGPLLYKSVPYDPLKDFAHIALIGVFPQFFAVRTDSPIETVDQLLSIARAKPGAINFASSGVGTAGFLSAAMLQQAAGINMVHVPYKGSTAALSDLLGGRLDIVVTGNVAELVRAGKVRIVAVTSEKRMNTYPDVPTLNESVPGVIAVPWMGISAPEKTPQAVVGRLESEIMAIATSHDMQTISTNAGMTPKPLNSVNFVAFIQNEMRTWAPIIKAGKISVD